MNLILIAPPAAGKGTMASMLNKKFGLICISAGELLRGVDPETELGKMIRDLQSRRELVSDTITNQLMKERLMKDDIKNGFILDGFPRNLVQAQALEKMSDIDKAILIDLSDDEIVKRLSSRRMCKDCGNPTSLDWLKDGRCEKCGGEVYVRDDDAPEVIRVRLKKQAVPQDVVEFYRNKNVLETVHAADSKEETFKLIEEVLKTI